MQSSPNRYKYNPTIWKSLKQNHHGWSVFPNKSCLQLQHRTSQGKNQLKQLLSPPRGCTGQASHKHCSSSQRAPGCPGRAQGVWRWKRLQLATAALTSSTMTQLKGSSPCREKADSSRPPPLVLSVQQMMSDSRMMSACTFWECPRTFKHNRTPCLKFSLNCNSECSWLGCFQ